MRSWLARLGVFVLLSWPQASHANFLERAAGRFQTLEKEISYRRDLGAEANIETVRAHTEGWVVQRAAPFSRTRDPILVWARFELPEVTAPRPILLSTSAWEHVEFFVVSDGRVIDRQVTGTLVPPAERSTHVSMTSLFAHSGFASVQLLPGAKLTVFARLSARQDYREIRWLRVYLWDAEEVRAGERGDRIFQGLFLGVMLVLIIYNLGLFVTLREPSYFYYVLTSVGTVAIWANLFGLTSEFLWPKLPAVEYYTVWLLVGVNLFTAVQFLRSFIDMPKFVPRAEPILRVIAASGLVTTPIALLISGRHLYVALGVVFLPAFVTFGVAIVVTHLARRAGHPGARHFMTAILCAVVGTLIQVLAVAGWLPSNDATLTASQVGNALMGIVLSVGLGFRLRQTQAELAGRKVAEALREGAREREKRESVEAQRQELEARVRERTAELAAAQSKSDGLLANILPQAVIEELKLRGTTEPRRHEDVSILFTDFAGFTTTVATIPPKRLVQELDEIFCGFDEIVAAHGLEKIKTIGDAYMAAAGLPLPAGDHAARCVRAALALTSFIAQRNESAPLKWGLRVGVHSGAVVAGVVGKHKYAYDVWGDTVNLASRLESASEPGRVNISAYTYDLVRDRFDCDYRRKLAAKGKGEIDMYFVVGEKIIEARATGGR